MLVKLLIEMVSNQRLRTAFEDNPTEIMALYTSPQNIARIQANSSVETRDAIILEEINALRNQVFGGLDPLDWPGFHMVIKEVSPIEISQKSSDGIEIIGDYFPDLETCEVVFNGESRSPTAIENPGKKGGKIQVTPSLEAGDYRIEVIQTETAEVATYPTLLKVV